MHPLTVKIQTDADYLKHTKLIAINLKFDPKDESTMVKQLKLLVGKKDQMLPSDFFLALSQIFFEAEQSLPYFMQKDDLTNAKKSI